MGPRFSHLPQTLFSAPTSDPASLPLQIRQRKFQMHNKEWLEVIDEDEAEEYEDAVALNNAMSTMQINSPNAMHDVGEIDDGYDGGGGYDYGGGEYSPGDGGGGGYGYSDDGGSPGDDSLGDYARGPADYGGGGVGYMMEAGTMSPPPVVGGYEDEAALYGDVQNHGGNAYGGEMYDGGADYGVEDQYGEDELLDEFGGGRY